MSKPKVPRRSWIVFFVTMVVCVKGAAALAANQMSGKELSEEEWAIIENWDLLDHLDILQDAPVDWENASGEEDDGEKKQKK